MSRHKDLSENDDSLINWVHIGNTYDITMNDRNVKSWTLLPQNELKIISTYVMLC